MRHNLFDMKSRLLVTYIFIGFHLFIFHYFYSRLYYLRLNPLKNANKLYGEKPGKNYAINEIFKTFHK